MKKRNSFDKFDIILYKYKNELSTYHNVDKLLIQTQDTEDRTKYGND